ncbi:MAG: ATP-binding protein [Patescibacteria group bacterium]
MIDSELPIYNKILVFLINFIGIWLTFVVYRYAPRKKIKRIFLGMFLAMFCWVNFAYLARFLGRDHSELSFLFLKTAWFATPILFFLIYFLLIFFLRVEKRYRNLSKTVLVLGIASSLIAGFSDLTIKGSKFKNGGLVINYGDFMLPFLIIVFFFMIVSFYVLYREYYKLSKNSDAKDKFFYILLGLLLFYSCNSIFNIILPIFGGIVKLYWIGDYSAIFLLSFIAYAVIKKELFGVKILFVKALIVIIAILLSVNIITSGSLIEYMWRTILFVSFLFFGYLLIKSVRREIEQREKLKSAYKKLQRIDESKTEFISIASHQLRTPLSAIKGYLSMVLEGDFGPVPANQKKALKKVYQSGDRLIQLVENLLNVSRISQGKMVYNFEKTDLREVVDKIVDELSQAAKKKKIKVDYKKPKKLALVNIDWEKMSEVITNLVDNAIKYTEKGKIVIKLQNAYINTDDPKVRFCITDTGMGVSGDDIKNLFKKFSRAPETSVINTEGTGLGLYVAKKIIEGHNGKIWVESKGKGKGAKFIFELPVA